MGHFSYALTLASGISAALALIDRKSWRERVNRGVYLMGSFVVAIFGVSWLMYAINP